MSPCRRDAVVDPVTRAREAAEMGYAGAERGSPFIDLLSQWLRKVLLWHGP